MKQTKGSALLWVVIVVMVLSIAVAGALSVSYTYYRRSVTNNYERQAYITSKNILENIVENIRSNDDRYIGLFDDLQEENVTSLTITLPAPMDGIQVEGDITKLTKEDTKGRITIRIKATVMEKSYTMKADMQLGKMDNGIESWQLLRYYEDK